MDGEEQQQQQAAVAVCVQAALAAVVAGAQGSDVEMGPAEGDPPAPEQQFGAQQVDVGGGAGEEGGRGSQAGDGVKGVRGKKRGPGAAASLPPRTQPARKVKSPLQVKTT